MSENASPSVQAHRDAAPEAIRCAVLTLSDTRTRETDKSGAFIVDALTGNGHSVIDYRISPDEPAAIRNLLVKWSADAGIDGILTDYPLELRKALSSQ